MDLLSLDPTGEIAGRDSAMDKQSSSVERQYG